MRLREQSRKQDTTVALDVVEADLIRQDGLARTWPSLNDVGRTGNQASLQQGVEAFDPTFKTFKLIQR
jgi:hypothetical protein